MGALDAMRARLAAQKAAANLPATDSVPAQATGASTGAAPAREAAAPQPQVEDADPFAGLTGIQLILAKKKAAEQAGKSPGLGATNRSAAANIGAVTGTGSNLSTATSKPLLAQNVLTPAQKAMDAAKQLLQNKEAVGFYTIDKADQLPEELPASLVSEKLRELDAALVLKTPQLAVLTVEINRNLRQYDELAYLLSDEQLGLIVAANLTIKNTELISTKTKSASAATRNTKIAASLTADDI